MTRWPPILAVPTILLLAACIQEQVKTPGSYPPAKADLVAAAKANTELGIAYAREGRLDVAQEKLKKAVDENEEYAPAHATLAYVFSQRGFNDEAQHEFSRALDLDPENPDTRNNYGVFLCSIGKSDEADRNFMRAIDNHDYTTPEAAWTNAGLCASSGSADRAEADFRHALQLNPQFPAALAQLAEISFRKNEYLSARAFIQRYEQSEKPGAALLWLGAQTERALGNVDGARDYEVRLVRNFPESPEAAKLGPAATQAEAPAK